MPHGYGQRVKPICSQTIQATQRTIQKDLYDEVTFAGGSAAQ